MPIGQINQEHYVFVDKMKPHTDLLQGSPSECENDIDFENMMSDAWSEKWSKYY